MNTEGPELEIMSKNDLLKKPKIKKEINLNLPVESNGIDDVDAEVTKKKRKIKNKKVLLETNATENSKQIVKKLKVMKIEKSEPEEETMEIKEEELKIQIKEEELEMLINEEIHIKEENEEETQPNETIDWPRKDLVKLMKRMEAALPEKDNLAFSTRAEKLNWDDIAFNEYSGETCKRTWLLIQKTVPRFRYTLSEVLQDAKECILKPWTDFYHGNKTKRHPDMPRRPLSAYMLFYLNAKDVILSENPGMEITKVSKKISQMYKNRSPAIRAKYTHLADEERKNYEAKLEEFYRLHPEVARFIEEPSHSKPNALVLMKRLTPFALYFEEQMKIIPTDSEVDRNTLKEQCKNQWRNMSDKKKVVWIDWALDKEVKYQDELKHYILQNPDLVPGPLKPILTKEDKSIKARLAGKPIKPPHSAYSLFSKMMLQSEEIKKICYKDRMKTVADQWKNCTDKEKEQYRERANHLIEQYKLDYASYLESLPQEKREEELQNNLRKRRSKTASESEEIPYKKKI